MNGGSVDSSSRQGKEWHRLALTVNTFAFYCTNQTWLTNKKRWVPFPAWLWAWYCFWVLPPRPSEWYDPLPLALSSSAGSVNSMASADLALCFAPPSLFSSKGAYDWLQSDVHTNQEAASMVEGNKYKMAAHIKSGIGLLPDDGRIVALIHATAHLHRRRPLRCLKEGGGLEPPPATVVLSRRPARRPRRAPRRPRPGPCPPLPPPPSFLQVPWRRFSCLAGPWLRLLVSRHGHLQVGVKWSGGGLWGQVAYQNVFRQRGWSGCSGGGNRHFRTHTQTPGCPAFLLLSEGGLLGRLLRR